MINQCTHLIHDNDPAEYRQLAVAEILHNNLSTESFLASLHCIPKTFDGGSFFPAYMIIAFIYYLTSLFTGFNYYSVKITALFFSTISFLFWLILLKENRKAMILMAIYLIAPPLFFLKWSLTLWAGSTECLFLYPLALYIHMNLEDTKKNIYIKGLTYGFAAYFSYLCLPLSIILTLDAMHKLYKTNKKDICHFILAITIGFSPWVLYQIFIADKTSLTLLTPYNIITTTKNLILNITAGPYFTPAFSIKNMPILKAAKIFLLINILAFPIAYLKNKNLTSKKLIFITTNITLLFLVMLSVSSYNSIPSDLRYYLPLYPIYAFILISIATAQSNTKIIKYTFAIIFILFSASNVRDNILFYKTGYPNAYKHYRAFEYSKRYINIPINQTKNLNTYIDDLTDSYPSAHTKGISSVLHTDLCARYFWETDKHGQNIPSKEKALEYIKDIEKDFTDKKDIEDFYKGVGFGFFLKNYDQNFAGINTKYHQDLNAGYINAKETFTDTNKKLP